MKTILKVIAVSLAFAIPALAQERPQAHIEHLDATALQARKSAAYWSVLNNKTISADAQVYAFETLLLMFASLEKAEGLEGAEQSQANPEEVTAFQQRKSDAYRKVLNDKSLSNAVRASAIRRMDLLFAAEQIARGIDVKTAEERMKSAVQAEEIKMLRARIEALEVDRLHNSR